MSTKPCNKSLEGSDHGDSLVSRRIRVVRGGGQQAAANLQPKTKRRVLQRADIFTLKNEVLGTFNSG